MKTVSIWAGASILALMTVMSWTNPAFAHLGACSAPVGVPIPMGYLPGLAHGVPGHQIHVYPHYSIIETEYYVTRAFSDQQMSSGLHDSWAERIPSQIRASVGNVNARQTIIGKASDNACISNAQQGSMPGQVVLSSRMFVGKPYDGDIRGGE